MFRRSKKTRGAGTDGGMPAEWAQRSAEVTANLDFSFFTPAEWQRFTAEVAASLSRVGVSDAQYGGGGFVDIGSMRHFLDQVARFCHLRPVDSWGAVLDNHFAQVTAPLSTDRRVDDLRVRLAPAPNDPLTISRDWAHGIVQELCFDLPTALAIALPNDLAALGLSVDDAFSTAWRQTLSNESADGTRPVEDVPDGARVTYVFGESLFVASLVDDLPSVVGDIGPDGAVVGIPSRNGFLVHRIGMDGPLDPAVVTIGHYTRHTFDQGIRPVSPGLYWWRDGELGWLPSTPTEDGYGFVVVPPAEWVEMRQRLGV